MSRKSTKTDESSLPPELKADVERWADNRKDLADWAAQQKSERTSLGDKAASEVAAWERMEKE